MRAALLLLALVAGAAGCPTEPSTDTPRPSPVVAPLPTDLAGVQAEIERLTASPTATSAAACRVVAYGSKPCGGPTRFVAVSSESTDTARVARLAERYTALETERNRREGLASDCMMVEPPPVALRGGVCVLGR